MNTSFRSTSQCERIIAIHGNSPPSDIISQGVKESGMEFPTQVNLMALPAHAPSPFAGENGWDIATVKT